MEYKYQRISPIFSETLRADERKLEQIIYNLLSNAVKFSPDGGEIILTAGVAHVSSLPSEIASTFHKASQKFIRISVTDSGIGIRQEDLERIFRPFEQVDSSLTRRFPGAGLGLFGTKILAELHDGRIWAESEGEGQGSAFHLVIPLLS